MSQETINTVLTVALTISLGMNVLAYRYMRQTSAELSDFAKEIREEARKLGEFYKTTG